MADILIIEDDAPLRDISRRALELEGHTVTEAANGVEGLGHLAEAEPDLVLVDIVMPEMDGIETIRRIRADAPGVRLLALSGGGNLGLYDYLKYAKVLGADDVMAKPFRLKEMVGRVAALLNTSGYA